MNVVGDVSLRVATRVAIVTMGKMLATMMRMTSALMIMLRMLVIGAENRLFWCKC